jgi:hypothetical protein
MNVIQRIRCWLKGFHLVSGDDATTCLVCGERSTTWRTPSR